jgi:hypothetical protein
MRSALSRAVGIGHMRAIHGCCESACTFRLCVVVYVIQKSPACGVPLWRLFWVPPVKESVRLRNGARSVSAGHKPTFPRLCWLSLRSNATCNKRGTPPNAVAQRTGARLSGNPPTVRQRSRRISALTATA